MLANGQTLRHKYTNRLARLDPTPGESWAWDIGKKTAFIAENGTKFIDNINNYTHVKDELGRPYFNVPKEGQFVDESAKKYLVSEKKMAEMRKKKLEEWEAKVLDRMAGNVKYTNVTVNGKVEKHTSDSAKKSVCCPFADGSKSFLFRDFFLGRRKAIPLYKSWSTYENFEKGGGFASGLMIFRHTDGQIWMYNERMSELVVIEEGSINIPEK